VTAGARDQLELERLFREMASRLPLIVWVHDASGEQVAVNDTFCEYFGVSREEMRGGRWQMLMHPDDAEAYAAEFYACVAARRSFHAEVRVKRADGQWRWLESWASPRIDDAGAFHGFLGASADITDRKQVEADLRRANEALRQSEERYRTLFESIDQGFCVMEMIFDDSGNAVDYWFVETNPAFERHTGLVNAAGKRARDLVPDLEDHWPEVYGRVATTGEPYYFVQGSEAMGRWFEVAASRVGRPEARRVALLFTDITERRRAEDALRESNRRKDEYLAMLGHELRNPLAAVQSATDLVKLSHDGDARLQRATGVLERQAGHMARLIDGLLEVSRIARGKIDLDHQSLDLRALLRDVVEDRAVQLTARNLELQSRFPDQPVWVSGDPVRLAQVFDNLVGNAVKFTPPGGLITVELRCDEGRALICIRDTGTGIRQELLEHIFEPFQQEEQDIARGAGGLGLGLALARSLVELHHGTIRAHSDGLGAGAVLEVELPLTGVPSRPRPAEDDRVPIAPRRILIVEDNADAAAMLRDLLELQGHEVTAVGTGRAALQVLEQEPADLVLCDLGLPGMSGYEVAREIRTDPALRGLTLVAVTGYGQPEDRQRTTAAGFDHHLIKPVDLREIERVLADLGARG
jgi:PAS domain S-box-containing protein